MPKSGTNRRMGNAAVEAGFKEGTVRFPLDRQPSPTLVRRLVRARVAELRPQTRPKTHRRQLQRECL